LELNAPLQLGEEKPDYKRQYLDSRNSSSCTEEEDEQMPVQHHQAGEISCSVNNCSATRKPGEGPSLAATVPF